MELLKLIGLILIHLHIGKVKPLRRNFKLLKRKSNCLFDERVAVKERMVRELTLQDQTTVRECQIWLQKVVEFEHEVNGMLEIEPESSRLDIPKRMELRQRLKDMINEISEYLEQSPFKDGPMVGVQYGVSKRMTGMMIEGKAYRTAKRAKIGKSQRKAESKTKRSIDTVKPPVLEEETVVREHVWHNKDVETLVALPIDSSIHVAKDKRQSGYVTVGDDTSFQSEAQTPSVAQLKDENAPPITSEFKVLSEILPTSVTESLSVPDLEHSPDSKAETKHVLLTLPTTEISARHGSEIELTPETKEALSIEGNLDTYLQKFQPFIHVCKDKRQSEDITVGGEIAFQSEAQTPSVAELKDEKAPAVTSEFEVLSEILPTSITESLSTPDLAHSPGTKFETKHVLLPLPTTQISIRVLSIEEALSIEGNLDTCTQRCKDKRQPGHIAVGGETSFESEAQTPSVAQLKDEKAPAVTSEFEVLSEIPPTSVTESLSIPDLAHSSSTKAETEHVLLPLPTTEVPAIHGSEIEHTAETKEALSIEGNLDTGTQRCKDKRQSGDIAVGGETSFESEAQTPPVAQLKDEKAPAVTSEFEVLSEIPPTSVTESLSISDLVHSSGAEAEEEHVSLPPPTTEISAIYGSEIDLTPEMTEALSMEGNLDTCTQRSSVGGETSFESEAQTPSVAQLKDEKSPAVASEFEMLSEIPPTSVTESLSIPDLVHSSGAEAEEEHVSLPPPTTEISAIYGSEIDLTPEMTEALSMEGNLDTCTQRSSVGGENSFESEAQTPSVAQLKDEKSPAVASEFEVLSEIPPTSVTESLSIPDLAHSSGTKAEEEAGEEHVSLPLPTTEISSIHGSEIDLTAEMQEALSLEGNLDTCTQRSSVGGETSFESETHTAPVAQLKDEKAPAVTDDFEVLSDILPTLVAESLATPDLAHSSGTKAEEEHVLVPLPTTEISAIHGSDIDLTPEMKEVLTIEENLDTCMQRSSVGCETSFESEAETPSVAQLKDEKAPAVASEFDVSSEVLPTSVTESLSIPDLARSLGTKADEEHVSLPLPTTEISVIHGSEIELIPETKEALSIEGNLDTCTQRFQPFIHVCNDRTQSGDITVGGETSFESEAHVASVAQLEDEKVPAMTDEFEVLSDILTTSDTESSATPDLARSSGTKAEEEHVLVPLPTTEISAIHSSEIELIPEVKEAVSMKDAENMETFCDKKERSLSFLKTESLIDEAETESVPEKPQVLPSSEKKDEDSRIGEAETELPSLAAGQFLQEPGYNGKKSINLTLHKILRSMKDDKARRIGIYGMSGIGKTTILKALVNYPETKSMFDLIIWVTISRPWNTRKVQKEVAIQLGLSVADSQTNVEIAKELLHTLQRRKFLLLLDNVCETVDLNAIGIPDPSRESGCKIVTATRSEHVCNYIAPDVQIKVEGLSREEAWELFREQVGGIIDSPDIQPFAQAIVSGCGALPLSIIVIGRALTGESDIIRWKLAARDFFSASPLKLQDSKAVLRQLKFSYDKLKDHEVKSVFLYCALLPEGHEIKFSQLVGYCIQEGLIAVCSADARKKVLGIVNDLVDASLLESIEGGLSVKMHTLIRDLGLWIISTEDDGCQFLVGTDVGLTLPSKEEIEQGQMSLLDGSLSKPLEVQESTSSSSMDRVLLSRAGAGLTELPPEQEWEQTQLIFLMDNEFSGLPERPNCPKLLMLFLQRNSNLRSIPSSFFDCMPFLGVLNLSKTKIRSLPLSLFRLTRLQVLRLRYCECLSELPPEVGNLERIEVLDLWGTEIYNLPDEISKLSFLKQLRVAFYGSLDHREYDSLPETLISRGVMSKLLALQELRIAVHPGDPRWDIDAEFVAEDLGSLNDLINLQFCFPDITFLELFIQKSPSWKSGRLTKFKFVIGQNAERVASLVPRIVEYDYDQEDRCLRYVNRDMIHDQVKGVLMCATAFYLDHHCAISSLSELGISNIKQLKFCILSGCPNILTTVDSSSGVTESTLPNLEHLSIHYLWNLRSIWEGPMPFGSFNALKTLSVRGCPNLVFVLTQSMLQYLSCLEELAVEDCASVEEIVKREEESVGDDELPKLKRLTLHYLPELVTIWAGSCLKIEQINISNCPKVKRILTSLSQKAVQTEIGETTDQRMH